MLNTYLDIVVYLTRRLLDAGRYFELGMTKVNIHNLI